MAWKRACPGLVVLVFLIPLAVVPESPAVAHEAVAAVKASSRAPGMLWSRTLDDEGGKGISLAIGTKWRPIVTYVDNADRVVLALCRNRRCKKIATEVIAASAVTTDTAVAIGASGNPLVASIEYEPYTWIPPDCAQQFAHCGEWWLRLVRCDDLACAGSSDVIMHEWLWDGTPYYYVDLIVRRDGLPAVSMEEHWNLQVLSCTDPGCAGWRRHYLSIGGEHTLMEGADGRMVLPSINGPRHHQGYPPTGLDLFACRSYLDCRSHRVVTVDDDAWFGRGPSAVVGGDGNLVIAYLTEDHGLRVARCLDPRCEATSIVDVDPLGIAEFGDTEPVPAPPGGWYVGSRPDTAMVLGSDGNPVIAYVSTAPEEGLKLIRCLDQDCSSTTEPIFVPGRFREIEMEHGPTRGQRDTVVLVYQELESEGELPARLTVAAFRI